MYDISENCVRPCVSSSATTEEVGFQIKIKNLFKCFLTKVVVSFTNTKSISTNHIDEEKVTLIEKEGLECFKEGCLSSMPKVEADNHQSYEVSIKQKKYCII